MAKDWQELTKLTRGERLIVERVRIADTGIVLEGEFELPSLAQLTAEDQVFVAAFVRSHGSIKQMEKFFGVSYPTIKNRLNRLGELLSFVDIEVGPADDEASVAEPAETATDVLAKLEAGEISVEDALNKLKQRG